jgi:hypothetical protein
MFKKLLYCVLGLSLASLVAATVALAQPGAGRRVGFQDRFQEIKRTQLGPALGVDQSTVDRLLQIEARYQPLRHKLIGEMQVDYRRLQQIMSQPSPSPQEVKTVLTDMKRKKREMQDLQTKQGDEEDAILNPLQQARYIMYLKTLLKEARNIKGGPRETEPFMPQGPREIPVSRPAR